MDSASSSNSAGNHCFLPPNSTPHRKDFWLADYYGKPTETLRVVICRGPGDFWLQNMKQEDELRVLRNKMTDWYNEYWSTYQSLKEDQVIIGGIYAAYWEKYLEWLRVRVIDTVPDPQGKGTLYLVQSLDYASLTLVSLESIFPLREVYNAELPLQAVKAELYNEAIPGTLYTQAQNRNFCDFVTARKDLDVMVMGERADPKWGCPIIRVIIATQSIAATENYKNIPALLYTLDGTLDFKQFFETIGGLHEQQS